MALSTGSNKIKTAVFISGTGSNLKSLIKFSKLKKSPIIIKMIISNNYKAKGLQYACLLYTSDAADEGLGVDLGGRRIIKKK